MFFDDKKSFSGEPSEISELLRKWKPAECKSEKDFEFSLYDFLHKKLEDTQITKQYARGRIHADIAIADKTIIELKTNLDSTGKYQRLIGQLAEYETWEGSVFIILTGETDKNLLKSLKSYIEKLNEKFSSKAWTFFDATEKFFLIEK